LAQNHGKQYYNNAMYKLNKHALNIEIILTIIRNTCMSL